MEVGNDMLCRRRGWHTNVEVVVTVGIVNIVGVVVHEQVIGILVVRVHTCLSWGGR